MSRSTVCLLLICLALISLSCCTNAMHPTSLGNMVYVIFCVSLLAYFSLIHIFNLVLFRAGGRRSPSENSQASKLSSSKRNNKGKKRSSSSKRKSSRAYSKGLSSVGLRETLEKIAKQGQTAYKEVYRRAKVIRSIFSKI
jgi:hypothetical protein